MRGVWLIRLVVLVCAMSTTYGIVEWQTTSGVADTDNLSQEPELADLDAANEESDDAESAPARLADDEAPVGVSDQEAVDNGALPANLALTGGAAGLTLLALFGAMFEFMRVVLLVALVTPLLAKRQHHREDELTKGRILGYIEANAGIHFSALRDGLGLANGVTAYHTNNLEREGNIISWKDGKHRRYASSYLSKDERMTVKNPLTGTRLAILEVLAEKGQLGTTTKDLQQRLDLSRQLLSHHLRQLRSTQLIEEAQQKGRKAWKVSARGFENLSASQVLPDNA
jgi:predicted transcriptional regulator